jgi:putative addiction module component (TIGR02574 family)
MDIAEIQKMSAAERIQLIQQIWGTLTPDNVEIPESQKQEVRRRLKDHKEGKTARYSWQSIKQELDGSK